MITFLGGCCGASKGFVTMALLIVMRVSSQRGEFTERLLLEVVSNTQ